MAAIGCDETADMRVAGSTSSLVLSATESNVLGALHPQNGSVGLVALSGPGGSSLRLPDVHTGQLISETFLHAPDSGRLLEPATLSVALTFGLDDDVYALTNGHTLRRVKGSTGDVVWGWTTPDHTSLVIYSDAVATPDAIYLLGLAKSFASYTLHVSTLAPTTGELVHETSVSSSITGGPEDLVVLSRPSAYRPVVAWLEQGRIHSLALSPELHSSKAIKPTVNKGSTYLHLQDVGLRDEEDASLKTIWEFSESVNANTVHFFGFGTNMFLEILQATSPKYTESIYTGGRDKDGSPYIARVFWSHVFGKASAHVFAPHLAEGKGLVTGFTFPFKTEQDGVIVHAALDATTAGDTTEETYKRVLSRLVLTTSTGSVQLWHQDKLEWAREEGLASVSAAGWVEIGDGGVSSGQVEMEEQESFTHRLQRQLKDAQGFPTSVVKFVKRFVSGNYAPALSASQQQQQQEVNTTTLSRDPFGFRKLIIVGTTHGKVYALDSASGEIVWSRVFGLGWAAEVGVRVLPVKMFVVKGVAESAQGEGNREGPEIVLVAQRKASNGLVDTVIFHVDALTGEDVSVSVDDNTNDDKAERRKGGVLEGRHIIAGSLVEAYLVGVDPSSISSSSTTATSEVKTAHRVKTAHSKFAVLLDEFLQLHLDPPPSPSVLSHFTTHILPSLHIPLGDFHNGVVGFVAIGLTLAART
ncbi:hypothetical protein K474DRAFT_1675313 [Panus rudis PR-1116 ss-1]|nr:hypothetical protein K474DRAFT_1675313 [Panus rudis PR-1116 ss-1]